MGRSLWFRGAHGGVLHARRYDVPGSRFGVLVVPGLGGDAQAVERWSSPIHAAELLRCGVTVLALDLSGRGRSSGQEDFGGPRQQADVRAALNALGKLVPLVGVLSLSLGCAAVAPALQGSGVAWWIDWEGPSDREIITAGGQMMQPAMGHSLRDEGYWQDREAVRFVGQTGVPYLRYQSRRDHAQPAETRHAMRMIRAAAAGSLPWFQLNDHEPGAVPSGPRLPPGGPRAASRWICRRVEALVDAPLSLLV